MLFFSWLYYVYGNSATHVFDTQSKLKTKEIYVSFCDTVMRTKLLHFSLFNFTLPSSLMLLGSLFVIYLETNNILYGYKVAKDITVCVGVLFSFLPSFSPIFTHLAYFLILWLKLEFGSHITLAPIIYKIVNTSASLVK